MLQHVEMVVADDSFQFALRPIFCSRDADVDGLTFKFLRLPVWCRFGDQPISHFRVANVQRPALGTESSLGPVDPESKLQFMLMGLIGDGCESVWKFLRIGIPVAYSAKPARVDVKHFEA